LTSLLGKLGIFEIFEIFCNEIGNSCKDFLVFLESLKLVIFSVIICNALPRISDALRHISVHTVLSAILCAPSTDVRHHVPNFFSFSLPPLLELIEKKAPSSLNDIGPGGTSNAPVHLLKRLQSGDPSLKQSDASPSKSGETKDDKIPLSKSNGTGQKTRAKRGKETNTNSSSGRPTFNARAAKGVLVGSQLMPIDDQEAENSSPKIANSNDRVVTKSLVQAIGTDCGIVDSSATTQGTGMRCTLPSSRLLLNYCASNMLPACLQ